MYADKTAQAIVDRNSMEYAARMAEAADEFEAWEASRAGRKALRRGTFTAKAEA